MLRRREGGQRRGDCLEGCVSILSRSLPVFLEIKDGRGGTGHTSRRRQLRGAGGRRLPNPRLWGCLWPDPASFSAFHRLVGSGPPEVREGRKMAATATATATATPPASNTLGRAASGQGHLASKSLPWPWPVGQRHPPPKRLGNRHLQEKQDFNLEPDCPGFESQAQPIVASVALVNYFTLGFGFLVS